MTRRTMLLLFLAVLSALPVMWMNMDPNAGSTLLAFTSDHNTGFAAIRP